jgi:hypothetical protein
VCPFLGIIHVLAASVNGGVEGAVFVRTLATFAFPYFMLMQIIHVPIFSELELALIHYRSHCSFQQQLEKIMKLLSKLVMLLVKSV